MAGSHRQGLYYLVACVLYACVHRLECCTPIDAPPFQDIIDFSDAVILGQVRATYTYTELHFGGDAYIAEMDVFCILKAPGPDKPPIEAVQNVSEAGFIPGLCFSADLEVGKQYFVLLSTSGDGAGYTPVDAPMEVTPDNIATMSSVCGLSPALPQGSREPPVNPTAYTCPQVAGVNSGGCPAPGVGGGQELLEKEKALQPEPDKTSNREELQASPEPDTVRRSSVARVVMGLSTLIFSLLHTVI